MVAGVDVVRAAVVRTTQAASASRVRLALALLLPTAVALLGSVLAWTGRNRPLTPPASVVAAARSSAKRSRAAVVDSSLPLEEALRRFRLGLPLVDGLSGGAPTRAALVRRFVRALGQRDTAAVRAMVLSRAEFAYLYYPQSPFTREPHKQMAGLVWLFTEANSSKGITRAFERLGGRPLSYHGHRCAAQPSRQGPNLLWEICFVQFGDGSARSEVRLFGSIIERDGQSKFVSYANDF
jgi:hypothetical protein